MTNKSAVQSEGIDVLPELTAGARIHIIGVSGSGMSAIARVLLERGAYLVSGSDRNVSAVGRALRDLGATIYEGHRAEQVDGADIVFASSAVPADNVEVQAARARGIPVLKRPQMLGWLTGSQRTVAVAGTHGKTTTTGLIALTLLKAGLDPSFIVGGVLPSLEANARAGRGAHFVIEADEYDRTFLGLRPELAVVTNVEMDHPDCYPTYEDVLAAFAAFVRRVTAGGCVVACSDDAGVRRLLASLPAGLRVVRYGLEPGADLRARQVRANGAGFDFDLEIPGAWGGHYELRLAGVHNVCNALAAIAVAQELHVDPRALRQILATFAGVARRFEVKGEAAEVTVIDDYAHHPTQIQTIVAAAHARYPGRTIWAVFQPHTFSRTLALLDDYRRSFHGAEHVLIMPIYAARELDRHEVTSDDLVRGNGHPDMRSVPNLQAAVDELGRNVRAGDVVLVMGAGDSYRVGEGVLDILRERER
jgi:UDP-N-acetylmuramate--alanine ligase